MRCPRNTLSGMRDQLLSSHWNYIIIHLLIIIHSFKYSIIPSRQALISFKAMGIWIKPIGHGPGPLWAKLVRKWDTTEKASNSEMHCGATNSTRWVTFPKPACRRAWARSLLPTVRPPHFEQRLGQIETWCWVMNWKKLGLLLIPELHERQLGSSPPSGDN